MKHKSAISKAPGTEPCWIELKFQSGGCGLEYATHLCTVYGRHHGHYFPQAHDKAGEPSALLKAQTDYEERCKELGVEPYPQRKALEALRYGLTASGYRHVHTWHESHGDFSIESYELETSGGPVGIRPTILTLSVYHDDRFPRLLPDSHAADEGSYLLAAEIKANEGGRWSPVGAERISACCTAGYQDFTHKYQQGRVWRVANVAGHGERARQVTPE